MILFYIYTVFIELLYFLISPILFTIFRMKPDNERLAIEYPNTRYDIIVHAASVGEINGIRQVLLELLNKRPTLRILLTTNTKTGRKTALGIHSQLDVTLSPLDVLHLRMKQINYSKPTLILITETEIWPNLMFVAKIKRIPIIYINARMSQKTYDNYVKIRSILTVLAQTVKVVCTQSSSDLEKYSNIFQAECIVAGNLKFSVKLPEFDISSLRLKAGYAPDDKIVVFGSSRPGEETLILNAFKALKLEFYKLKLIVAPRHIERIPELTSLFKNERVSYHSKVSRPEDIHIIDAMGILPEAYAMSDVAIIGGSFYPFGGHNPLEAAFYTKPIIMGPNFNSCNGTVELLIKADAILISSIKDLESDLRNVLQNPNLFKDYGIRARHVLEENGQSLPIHLKTIERFLD
jgi:3-deoxy-D-manno-octulosonic-acid transferase